MFKVWAAVVKIFCFQSLVLFNISTYCIWHIPQCIWTVFLSDHACLVKTHTFQTAQSQFVRQAYCISINSLRSHHNHNDITMTSSELLCHTCQSATKGSMQLVGVDELSFPQWVTRSSCSKSLYYISSVCMNFAIPLWRRGRRQISYHCQTFNAQCLIHKTKVSL